MNLSEIIAQLRYLNDPTAPRETIVPVIALIIDALEELARRTDAPKPDGEPE